FSITRPVPQTRRPTPPPENRGKTLLPDTIRLAPSQATTPNPARATYDMGCTVNEKVKRARRVRAKRLAQRRVLVVSTVT
ncbi:MAG TPA: hypothetical protein VGB05_02030, partial [Pyrinomonadaceae bacterium]